MGAGGLAGTAVYGGKVWKMNQWGRLLVLDTSSMCQEGDAHSGTFGSRFPTTQILQVRTGKVTQVGETPRPTASGRRRCCRHRSARVSQGGYLDVENVIEDAVEPLVQQRLHVVLDVGLPLFVVFARVQT